MAISYNHPMEAYHGTLAGIFDSFSLGHALEGDGKVKFGWGVYVTEKYGTAAHYAFNKHRPTWAGPNIMGRLLMELRDSGTLSYRLPDDAMVFSDLLEKV